MTGATSLIVDHGTLTKAAAALDQAGQDLDACGSGSPKGGDYGEAGVLLAAILGQATETAARISFEVKTLAAAVSQCNQITDQADQDAAETYLVEG